MQLTADAARRMAWLAVGLMVLMTVWGVVNTRNLKFDFANFYDAGQRAAAGEFATLYDAKSPIAGHEPFGNMSYYSAPLTSYLFVPIAGFPPRTATVIFKAAGAVAQVLGLWLLWREARRLSPPDDRSVAVYTALAAVTALGFQPIYSWMFVGGQTTPFVFLLVVLGWIAFLREGHVRAALALSAVVVIKPAFAPLAFVVFVCAPWRFGIAALVTGGLFVGLSIALLGFDVHRQFIEFILGKTTEQSTAWRNSNPFSWLEPLLPGDAGGLALKLLKLAAALAVGGWLARTLMQDIALPARRHAIWIAGILVALTLSPVVWTHYLIVLLVMAFPLFALRRHLPQNRWPLVLWLGLLAVSVVQNKLVMGKIEEQMSLEHPVVLVTVAFLKSLPMMVALGLLWAWRGPLAASLADRAWGALGRAEGAADRR